MTVIVYKLSNSGGRHRIVEKDQNDNNESTVFEIDFFSICTSLIEENRQRFRLLVQ